MLRVALVSALLLNSCPSTWAAFAALHAADKSAAFNEPGAHDQGIERGGVDLDHRAPATSAPRQSVNIAKWPESGYWSSKTRKT